jgi:GrpB-like predicted nucleotidyltransferase (UPF0157 family)
VGLPDLFDSKEVIDISSLVNNYTKEELEHIVSESFSFAEVLSKLGYSTKGGNNNKTLKDRIEYYGISTDHFTTHARKRDWTDDEIFCEDSKVSQPTLRRTFKKREFVPYKCAVCGRTEQDDESLEFRYCSRCNGNYEYCQDHLFTHQHIQ